MILVLNLMGVAAQLALKGLEAQNPTNKIEQMDQDGPFSSTIIPKSYFQHLRPEPHPHLKRLLIKNDDNLCGTRVITIYT